VIPWSADEKCPLHGKEKTILFTLKVAFFLALLLFLALLALLKLNSRCHGAVTRPFPRMGAYGSRAASSRKLAGLILDIEAARVALPASNEPIAWERDESVVAHCVTNTLENIRFHAHTGAHRRVAPPGDLPLYCLRAPRSPQRVAFSPGPPALIPGRAHCAEPCGARDKPVPAASVEMWKEEEHGGQTAGAGDWLGALHSSASSGQDDDDIEGLLSGESWWPSAADEDVVARAQRSSPPRPCSPGTASCSRSPDGRLARSAARCGRPPGGPTAEGPSTGSVRGSRSLEPADELASRGAPWHWQTARACAPPPASDWMDSCNSDLMHICDLLTAGPDTCDALTTGAPVPASSAAHQTAL